MARILSRWLRRDKKCRPYLSGSVHRFGRKKSSAWTRGHQHAFKPSARRQIEEGKTALAWKRCEAEGNDGTELAGCSKLYVPLDTEGASAAPDGFVFRLAKTKNNALVWNFIAFGERHPENPSTRNVYERAHKRLHGRYP